jgi:predicted Rossmann-fold nucleotide-binding protein
VDTKKKDKMNDLCDGVIVSWRLWYFEELFEMLTWAQLDFIKKARDFKHKRVLRCITGFNSDHGGQRILKPSNQEMLLISDTIDELLDKMEKYQAQ